MTHPDAARWNGRYQTNGLDWLQSQPRRMLLDFAYLLPPTGMALDAASGVAVNGLYLAQRGLQVVALDISEIALRLAQKQFRQQSLRLDTAVYDLAHPWLPANYFDVILNFRFLERETFPIYRQALKPGGWLFFETFIKTGDDGPYPHYYLNPGELRTAFADLDIHHWAEQEVKRNGRLYKFSEQLIAQKPTALYGD